jgi:DNA invertase Pin-like site-specific DNA recombinase
MDRPQLKKLLRLVRRGRVDAVVVARLAVLARSPEQFDHLMREFERHEVRLISVEDEVDMAGTTGQAKTDAIRALTRTLRAMDGHRGARANGASNHARCA